MQKANKILKISFLVIFMLGTKLLSAAPKWENTLRSNGKIYVVVGVLLIILVGLVLYLIAQELRIRKIEKFLNKDNK